MRPISQIDSLSRRHLVWRCGKFVFSLDRPLIMGIVNVTDDSFSDGGLYVDAKRAIAHGLKLAEEGAHIIDVGGESTRPGAPAVDEETEKQRVLPVIESLARQGIAVSVDTMKPAVMEFAIQAGACILNDVSGFGRVESLKIAAKSNCGLVVMHMQGTPQTMQESPRYDDVVSEVANFLQQRAKQLIAYGVETNRICLDPGIGFGKTLEHNIALLRHLPLVGDGYPILVGISRKSLLGKICQRSIPAERDFVSATAAAILAYQGANIIRAHHVASVRDALAVAKALCEDAP